MFGKIKNTLSSIILSRTDSVGDIILTLPMAAVLKQKFPGVKIILLGSSYTKQIVETCIDIDEFIDKDDFLNEKKDEPSFHADCIIHVLPNSKVAKRAKQLKIKYRIGTRNRLYHWSTCNFLVSLSRKKARLNESQLNLKLLQPFGISKIFSLKEIAELYEMKRIKPLQSNFASLLQPDKFNIILHPKSRGSAREWSIDNFIALIRSLDKNSYRIFISGVEAEKKFLQKIFDEVGNEVVDITGLFSLEQFISFINQSDGVVACSTGPVHISAALGKNTIGLYVPLWSIRAERWGPVGKKVKIFSLEKDCKDCLHNKEACHCIAAIQPEAIKNYLDAISVQKNSALKI